MGSVLVSKVKPGDKLLQDVQTPLGNLLFNKGVVVTARELDILNAFLIKKVVVETAAERSHERQTGRPNAEEAAKDKENDASEQELSPFQREYDATLQLVKKVFNNALSGEALPVLDIRNQLEKLLSNIGEYNVLTYIPSGIKENEYLYHNSLLSALTSYLLARWNGFPAKDWMQITLAGLLHDIGNVKVDRSILAKPTKLTSEETEEVRRHTVYGYQLLKSNAALNEGAKLVSLQHHEREDGSGYPLGISSDKIHPYAKIVAIADIFQASTLNKVYRKATSPYLVLEQIQKDAFGKLEPTYVRTFIEKATQFHNGTVVRISDGRVGEIVFSDRDHPTRPWVSSEGTIINLTTERQLYIEEVLAT
ncbi:metal dependent phosphohydrolase [Paenibacillus curdlanolyticus YK9]|uniref:Metal dependent phosphohydrolase n=1 Tax=Paenibacillus curdlanolyticus YK9 TaxID=717606 RepID=E0I976_9BACL|nr:HD-GYP domain-containing protein [Paenibacillus curdlanolyticus]EFM10960.1 metal dependent phosphohydrolase [Paenibacillus curdlanolyticus YK9]